MPELSVQKLVGIAACIAVILFSTFIYTFQLGVKPFWDYDEAIYANVIHDTIQNGDYLTLHRDGAPWFQKPPLVFWTSIGFDRIFLHPEFSYRLTAALSAILSVVLVMLIAYEVSGNLFAAAIAGSALATTGPFLLAGRELRLDVPAVAMVLFTTYAFLRGQQNSWWFVAVGAGIALGFMTKSVIGLLSLPFIFFWVIFSRDISWLKKNGPWVAVLTLLVFLAPWHIYQHIHYGGTFWNVYLVDVLNHANNDTLGGSSSIANYLLFFMTHAAPWSVLFVLSMIWLLSQYKKFKTKEMQTILIFACTTIAIFAAFAVSSTKINMYLQPVYPFTAMVIALCSTYILNRIENLLWRGVVVAMGVTIACVAVWAGFVYGYHFNPQDAANDHLVSEEKAVADIIATHPMSLDLYAYNYDYYDTIEFYTSRREIKQVRDDMPLSQPFLMIAPKWFMDTHPFLEKFAAHFTVLYVGQLLILYRFSP